MDDDLGTMQERLRRYFPPPPNYVVRIDSRFLGQVADELDRLEAELVAERNRAEFWRDKAWRMIRRSIDGIQE